MSHLKSAGVVTSIHYPIPIHLHPAFSDLGYSEGSFPEAERLSREALSLPLFPELREDQVGFVCDSIRRFFTVGGE
jgi:dTDP-4-amino-4,6-dideoxygalactose transaminase